MTTFKLKHFWQCLIAFNCHNTYLFKRFPFISSNGQDSRDLLCFIPNRIINHKYRNRGSMSGIGGWNDEEKNYVEDQNRPKSGEEMG